MTDTTDGLEQRLDEFERKFRKVRARIVRPGRREQHNGNAAPQAKRFTLQPFSAIAVSTERAYLVKGIIPRAGLTLIWGPPKCGKSFWTFDLAMHIALGWPYRRRRVQQGAVVYLALEGGEGFKARLEAFRQHHKVKDAPFFLITDRTDLIRDHRALIADIREQMSEAQPPALVVIDTLNRSLAGSESKDEDMAKYIQAADAVRDAFGCAVAIVHHCGVDGTRPRGHTSLTGAADAQLAVKRDAMSNVIVDVEWLKDGVEGDTIISRLVPIEVGTDIDGEPVTSCTVAATETDVTPTKEKKRLAPIPLAALRQLNECLADRGRKVPNEHAPVGVTSVTLAEWRDQLLKAGILNREGNPRQQFQRIRVTLSNAGAIGIWDDIVWAVT
jgi:hypothetical protein